MKDKATPAFPVSALVYNYDDKAPDTILHDGMTLRDYFAAKAMGADMTDGIHENDFAWSAARAYKMADEMLKAREA